MGIFNKFLASKTQSALLGSQLQTPNELTALTTANVSKEKTQQLRNAAVLEAVTSKVMVADANFTIVQMNPAATKMMRDAEADIKSQIPAFSVDTLVGSKIDIFHKNPAHQRAMIDALTKTHYGKIKVGGRSFDLIANPIFDKDRNRLGTVVEWQDTTEQQRQAQIEAEKHEIETKAANDNARIKAALNAVTASVMVADENNIIVYANPSVQQMLREAEADIRKALPQFNSDKVIGGSIDQFHKNPAHQQHLLKMLTSVHRAQIKIGVRTFSLIASPVKNDLGERLCTVVEWQDKTAELNFETLVNETIDAAAAGVLNKRIANNTGSGFLANLSVRINKLMETFEAMVSDVGQSIGAMARGDLTRTITTDYQGNLAELKGNINTTIGKLVEVLSEVHESTITVQESATEISHGNTNLSNRTEQQAASLEETSSAMEEITTTVQQNAANAVQANNLAKGAREIAEDGGDVVNKAISAMQAISESSSKINEIIGVIDEIAFQTNLLALNAAVEAARAGDQGRGFAVVADEVRNLAGRSAKAAKEIKDLIKDSGEKVKEGSLLVNKSGSTLNEIVAAVKKVNDIVAEISTASDEQATGLDEINRAISDMDSMTQQNAALVEQAAAASMSLSEQASSLESLTAFFNTGASVNNNQQRAVTTSVETAKPKLSKTPLFNKTLNKNMARRAPPKAPTPQKEIQKPKLVSAKTRANDVNWSEF